MPAVLVAVHTVTQDSLHPFINFLHYCSPYSGFYCAEKDNRGRCTDTPSGHHIIWTIGAPTSIIPPFFATTLTIYPGMGQSLNNAGVKWMVKESTHSCPVLPWPLQHIDCTHTHTFNGPFSRTTQVRRYQKGKTNLDFTEARDTEWQWHQLGHVQVCTLLQADNHASTPPLSFYRPDALPTTQPPASKY